MILGRFEELMTVALSFCNRIFGSISTLHFFLKIEATYSIAQIVKSGCNLIAT